MAKIETFICDICEKDRREDTNHWMTAFSTGLPGEFCIGPLTRHRQATTTDGVGAAIEPIDVCGNECATKLFQRWLTTGKLTQ